jgi:hypothetical protein
MKNDVGEVVCFLKYFIHRHLAFSRDNSYNVALIYFNKNCLDFVFIPVSYRYLYEMAI